MLLILRVEFVCIIILMFLLVYYSVFKIKDKELFFLKLSCIALSHVIAEACLVITMTYWGFVGERLTRIVYVAFYATGIAFAIWFFSYVVRRLAQYKHSITIRVVGYILLALCIALLSFLPLGHEHGQATYYSNGTLELVGYGVFLLYCVTCSVVLLSARKKLGSGLKPVLTPVVFTMLLTVLLQMFLPQLHLTGGLLTAICVTLFAVLDNPDKDFTKQALWDFSTGLKNRNSYNQDLAKYTDHSFRKKPRRIGLLIADMNYLKAANDHYGHIEGDRLLQGAAAILKEQLRCADEVYRLGGDEFIAIYLGVDDTVVEAEMANVIRACREATEYATPLSFAMGYAVGTTDGDLDAVFREADRKMYADKARIKETLLAP